MSDSDEAPEQSARAADDGGARVWANQWPSGAPARLPTHPARSPPRRGRASLSLSLSPHCCGRGVAGSLQLPTSWARLAPFPLRAGQLDTLEAQCQHSDVLAGDIYIPPVGWGASHLWEAPA